MYVCTKWQTVYLLLVWMLILVFVSHLEVRCCFFFLSGVFCLKGSMDFSELRGVTGVASLRGCQKLPPCLTELRRDPELVTAYQEWW